MRRPGKYYSKDERLLDMMWPGIWLIFTVEQLKQYLLAFPYEEPAKLLLQGIEFLSEPFVTESGAPDKRKIWERRRILEGPRLTDDRLVRYGKCA